MNLKDVRTLLQAYDLGRAPFSLYPISKGMQNENYRVETPAGQYVLRVYSLIHATTGPRTPAEIAFELDWVDHLRRRRVPTPALIRTRAGAIDRAGALYTKAIIDGQVRYAALFEYARGEEAPAYTPEIARAVAQVLLQIRKASSDFQYTTIRAWPGDIIRLSLDFYYQQRKRHHPQAERYQPVLDRLYEETVEGYHQVQAAGPPRGVATVPRGVATELPRGVATELPRGVATELPRGVATELPRGVATELPRGVATDLPRGVATVPRGVVHGDIKLENLLFAGDQVTAVLDFDDYRESFLLEELTRTLMHDLDSPTRNAIRAGCFPIFQQVFAGDPSISAAELRHLPTFLKARFLYDLSAYMLDGNEALVDALFADPHVMETLFS